MNCEEAKNAIPLAAGGDGPEEARELGSHLEACPACRREWEVFTGLRETLREAGQGPAPVADDEFLRGVYRRSGQGQWARPGTAGTLRWILRASAAAAILASLIVALVLTDSTPGPEGGGKDPIADKGTSETKTNTGTVTTLPPVDGPEVFGLADAGPPETEHDVLLESQIVPEPGRPEGTEEDAFPLQEVIPVSEAEVCADF
jgi:hypothetical protein